MYDVLIRPLVTEKNTLRAQFQNEYAFEVRKEATRSQVKKSIEKLFGVKVIRVNTLVSRRQPRKLGKHMGKRVLWKKAIVKLKEGDKFDFVAT